MFCDSGRPLNTLLLPTYILEDGRQQYDIPMPAEVPNPTQVLPRTRPKPADPIIPHETHLSDTLFNASGTPFGPLSDRLAEPFRPTLWHPLGTPS